MTIKEIYEHFDKIGCLTFATVNDGYPDGRIAHFVAFDVDGLYFMTAKTKPFYKQLIETGKVSVCGMNAGTSVTEDDDGMPIFDLGYMARILGDTKEIPLEIIKEKAAKNKIFEFPLKDIERYPMMTTFCLYRGRGEIFDYDFEKNQRGHKLERTRFAFGGMDIEPAGLTITDDCIGCGQCVEDCSFDAITEGAPYVIDGVRCDECGSCFDVCPAGAIISKGD